MWLFFPQLHVVYAQWTNVWSLNYWCGYWSVVYLLNCCVVIELTKWKTDKTEMKDCSTWTVPGRVFNERVGNFFLLFLLLSFCKLILKYSRESESNFNIGEGNVLHFRIWEISRLLSNNICWRDSCVWDSLAHNPLDILYHISEFYLLRILVVSSVGRAPVCWAGGHGFEPRPDQHSGSLK